MPTPRKPARPDDERPAKRGRGRPRSAEKFETEESKVAKIFACASAEMAHLMLARARGFWVEQEMPDGMTGFYRREPEYKAIEYSLNRFLGRPKEAVELTGKDGESVQAVYFYIPKNGRDADQDAPEAEAPGDPAE